MGWEGVRRYEHEWVEGGGEEGGHVQMPGDTAMRTRDKDKVGEEETIRRRGEGIRMGSNGQTLL